LFAKTFLEDDWKIRREMRMKSECKQQTNQIHEQIKYPMINYDQIVLPRNISSLTSEKLIAGATDHHLKVNNGVCSFWLTVTAYQQVFLQLQRD